MARDRETAGTPPESVISIIAPGTTVVGDLQTDGTIRVEGTVQGTIQAGKAVVVGREGLVDGDIFTQDAVISGRVAGSLVADSRLELQATCRIEGTVWARRMQLEEGAILNGTVEMGDKRPMPTPEAPKEKQQGHETRATQTAAGANGPDGSPAEGTQGTGPGATQVEAQQLS